MKGVWRKPIRLYMKVKDWEKTGIVIIGTLRKENEKGGRFK